MQRIVLTAIVVVVLLQITTPAQAVPIDQFVVANGVKLHFLDWGGTGAPILFLTGGGGTAHEFDALAVKLTDSFRVVALTRRGQGLSEKPSIGYDTATLAEDIRAFLDLMRIDRVTLAGYSIAGDEQTRFATRYPARINQLVYLDAAYDRASGNKLTEKLQPIFQLPIPKPDPITAAIRAGAQAADPEYKAVVAPALAFYVVYDTPRGITPGMDAATRVKMETLWNDHLAPFAAQQRDRFRREMERGHVVELRNTDHQSILRDPRVIAEILSEMRRFLGAE